MSRPRAIPDGSLVLITGATGFVGHRVAELFVKEGYRIRVTYRSRDKAETLRDKLDAAYGPGRLELMCVPNMAAPDAYGEAIKGVSAVLNVASDVSFSNDADAVIDSVVDGNINLYCLAAEEPSVKRFVQTSSATAISSPRADDFVYDDTKWNEEAMELAYSLPADDPRKALMVYSASKAFGEKALWGFVERMSPDFVVNTVLPDFTIGPVLDDKFITSTAKLVNGLWVGDEEQKFVFLNLVPQQWWVHVEDIALLHLGATIFEDVQNERLLGLSERFTVNDVLRVMREVDPSRELPADVEVRPDQTKVETGKCLEILKRLGQDGWRPFEETIRSVIPNN